MDGGKQLAARGGGAGSELAAAAAGDVAARDALLERLRRDRDAHFHGQIWTQDAAGGYARVPVPASAADAEAGGELCAAYRRLPSRPTTNFVGDAMMQGSIDLIQDELRQFGGPSGGGRAPPARLPWPASSSSAAAGGGGDVSGGELELAFPTRPPASAAEAEANVERMRLLLVRRRAAPAAAAMAAPQDAQQRE